MSNIVTRSLGRKLRIGRFSVPAYLAVAAGLAVTGVAAGQAVGPVLAGSVTGSVGLTVEQAVMLDVDNFDLGDRIEVTGADDAVTTTNDEGTEFSVAMELNVGQNVEALSNLFKATDEDAAMILELNVPAGIDVEIIDEGGLEEAQLNRGTWLMAVDSESSDFTIEIEPKDDLKPGFYTITGCLVQIGG